MQAMSWKKIPVAEISTTEICPIHFNKVCQKSMHMLQKQLFSDVWDVFLQQNDYEDIYKVVCKSNKEL